MTTKPTAKEIAKEKKPSLRYQRDKDREMVRGRFRFFEVPGGMMSFVFKKYKEDPVERFDMVDGQVYTIPLGVAKHLANNCWYPKYGFIKSESGEVQEAGQVGYRVTEKVYRCGFESLEFTDIEDLPTQAMSSIVTLENAI